MRHPAFCHLTTSKCVNPHYPSHTDLNLAGLQRWKADWPHLINPCGSLVFGDDDSRSLTDAVYPAQRLGSGEVLQREPGIAPGEMGRRGVWPRAYEEVLGDTRSQSPGVVPHPVRLVCGPATGKEPKSMQRLSYVSRQ